MDRGTAASQHQYKVGFPLAEIPGSFSASRSSMCVSITRDSTGKRGFRNLCGAEKCSCFRTVVLNL